MRFAYVLSQYPARSETFIAREMQALVDAGHDVQILRMRWSDTGTGEQVQGADVSPVLLRPDQTLWGLPWAVCERGRTFGDIIYSIWQLSAGIGLKVRLAGVALAACAAAARLRSQSIDHVRAHFLDMEAVGAYWLARFLGVSFSITAQTTIRRLPDPFLGSILDAASLRIATTRATHHFLTEVCPGRPVTTIRSGLRLDSIPERPRRVPKDSFHVLAVGRLVPKKGFGFLLDACSRLQREGVVPIRCTVIGDGPCREDLEREACQMNLQDHVTFRGALPFRSVQKAYTQADLLVVPSRRDPTTGDVDGLPNVLIEAAAARLPVLATRIGGIEDLVQPGRTGALVESGDTYALAEEVKRIWSDYDNALQRAEAAQRHVRVHFDLNDQVQRLVKAIRDQPEC